ncbi:hypothetical protein [Anaeromyxobacter sp. Fw109-5]|uniref:hypothetical protein n=1 Tax=Anaeromyxobacter sp. (strain Fw109-5) TaxID=404589 RepID=UPI0000ED81CB|nr:hypothetical protein [Anaeromyxobacter sp. Fw109-5]ABS25973.1 conserved hypothetical membrane protein [Anaeromyxobacter sp. Fw109-5]
MIGPYARLAAIPFAGAAAVAALSLATGGGPLLWFGTQLAAQSLAAAGCLAAAAAFERRDFMFRAWLLSAISFLLPVLNKLTSGPRGDWLVWRSAGAAHDVFYILAVNATAVVSAALFVAAFFRAGLVLGGSRARSVFDAAVVLLALGLGVPTLLRDVSDALAAEGASQAFFEAVSVAGDTLCFVLVAPLFRIARRFRGGALQWPWGLLAASNLCWLFYDAAATGARVAGSDALRVASEVVLAVASLSALAAALAHRRVVAESGAAAGRPVSRGALS